MFQAWLHSNSQHGLKQQKHNEMNMVTKKDNSYQ